MSRPFLFSTFNFERGTVLEELPPGIPDPFQLKEIYDGSSTRLLAHNP
jgi:hypothetical protein